MRIVLVFALALASCAKEPAPLRAAELGALTAADPGFAQSEFNDFACTTCHAVETGDRRILPGRPLPGAASRPSYWGGHVLDFKAAVDACLVLFMKGEPIGPDTRDSRELYEYLVSLREGPREALPLTVHSDITQAIPRGDPERGRVIHELACSGCHGPAGNAAGTRLNAAPILPDEARDLAVQSFPTYAPADVFIEKVRHGSFFLIGGSMPPFSQEALSDEDLGALLAFYGL